MSRGGKAREQESLGLELSGLVSKSELSAVHRAARGLEEALCAEQVFRN